MEVEKHANGVGQYLANEPILEVPPITHADTRHMIHPRRSKETFFGLIEDWAGLLVSDGYGVYQSWVNARQTWYDHLVPRLKLK